MKKKRQKKFTLNDIFATEMGVLEEAGPPDFIKDKMDKEDKGEEEDTSTPVDNEEKDEVEETDTSDVEGIDAPLDDEEEDDDIILSDEEDLDIEPEGEDDLDIDLDAEPDGEDLDTDLDAEPEDDLEVEEEEEIPPLDDEDLGDGELDAVDGDETVPDAEAAVDSTEDDLDAEEEEDEEIIEVYDDTCDEEESKDEEKEPYDDVALEHLARDINRLVTGIKKFKADISKVVRNQAKELTETKLFVYKISATSRLLAEADLPDVNKARVIRSIDKAKTVGEVNNLVNLVKESLRMGIPREDIEDVLRKGMKKRSTSSSSLGRISKKETDRMQYLAGIKD